MQRVVRRGGCTPLPLPAPTPKNIEKYGGKIEKKQKNYPSMSILWHSSVDTDKISLFPNFRIFL